MNLVIKNTGSWYTVLTESGETVDCKIKGNFRLKGIKSTNPVAVGDHVEIVRNQEGTAFINKIHDRRNYIVRKSINLSKQSHILAANVDQACLVVTVANPETSTTFIDRFLASAEAYSVPVILLFNKTDLLDDELKHYQDMMVNLYETIGYQCIQMSAQTGFGIEKLKEVLKGKISLFSGNSGVGKSTLLNSLIPGLNLKTSEISDAYNLGQHTTTFSEMIPFPTPPDLPIGEEVSSGRLYPPPVGSSPLPVEGLGEVSEGVSWLIDTPGVKGFGSFDMKPEEISSYFKEIFHFSRDCRFNNCTHTHEPGCAVLRAIEDHYIAESRYKSYLSMMEDDDDNKYREAE
ncbi:MAG: ribosome small subunit-dependent GTPase A [Bacteroidaceae bacterium]|nr:ribosome small subunit-dependent GTPase A [Bacteroidaceae bacterium]